MPNIFEIFGYPIEDRSEEAQRNRLAARCPFMNRDCDGGGNRNQSNIDLTKDPELRALYPQREKWLNAGVCSIQVQPKSTPWIVCPRRLLVLGRERAGTRTRQRNSELETLRLLDYTTGTRLGVWSEVKMIHREERDDTVMSFDYTFDYVLLPLASVPLVQLLSSSNQTDRRINTLRNQLEKAGYPIALRDGQYFVEDFPVGLPTLIEIMTSSTSGGNKEHGTTIPQAFKDAILGRPHAGPGINYRQVWARMVSQLIVKSEIALSWGGKTIWVVQDLLIDYISASTALNIRRFLSERTSEVNMLSFSYGDAYRDLNGVIELSNPQLFAGPASTPSIDGSIDQQSFEDIIHLGVKPPLSALTSKLALHAPTNYVVVP